MGYPINLVFCLRLNHSLIYTMVHLNVQLRKQMIINLFFFALFHHYHWVYTRIKHLHVKYLCSVLFTLAKLFRLKVNFQENIMVWSLFQFFFNAFQVLNRLYIFYYLHFARENFMQAALWYCSTLFWLFYRITTGTFFFK